MQFVMCFQLARTRTHLLLKDLETEYLYCYPCVLLTVITFLRQRINVCSQRTLLRLSTQNAQVRLEQIRIVICTPMFLPSHLSTNHTNAYVKQSRGRKEKSVS